MKNERNYRYEPNLGINAEIKTGTSVLSGNRALLADVIIEDES